ncbi:hypothetical protein L2E82_35124 [Cichorium intybus]|uniref:Uncharacterized protein n=1 Tax=Cichorium intybus TaxID=13427 RepID=A0ACB9BN99_CICIN|nr:hypothetical protein L2E82_35124 [Cichorium intybus]
MLTVLENCRVSPPPSTVGERCLPLTFLDMLWIRLFPIHHVFFYEFPHSREHFLETIVPNLKHSLSITLQHFFPFAGNLILFLNPSVEKKPEIRHVEGDSVAVTVAECTLDFNDLTGNHPRKCDMFYPLVPLLGRATKVSDYLTIPVFSVQVTLFPNSGISIGITNHHSLCDATTRHDFLKAWSSIAMHGTDELFLASGSLPFYERVVKYPSSFDEMALKKAGISAINADYQPRQLSLSEAVKKKNGLIEDGETLIKAVFVPVPGIGVAGSTKIKIYDLDFGWGKPKKYETISIDYRSSIISVNASKESPADIEIGASLPAKQMDAFISIHSEELEGTFY